jgi:hypothetical protein
MAATLSGLIDAFNAPRTPARPGSADLDRNPIVDRLSPFGPVTPDSVSVVGSQGATPDSRL